MNPPRARVPTRSFSPHSRAHSLSLSLSLSFARVVVLELETPVEDTQNTKYCAVKVEIRDPVNKDAPRQKRKTEMKEVFDHRIDFSDAFEFAIDEDKDEELRILLFKQKTSSFIGGKKAVANAGSPREANHIELRSL